MYCHHTKLVRHPQISGQLSFSAHRCYTFHTMINKKRASAQPLTKAEEYKEIAKDLHQVLWLNLAYLALVLALFFTDRKYQYLTKIFSHLWK